MHLHIEKMTENKARHILNWKYEEPYDLYNNEVSDEALKEMLDGSYYALLNEQNDIVGFFCIGKNAQVPVGHQFDVYADSFVDMGLGMDPSLVGKGNGTEFCTFIIQFIEEQYVGTPIRLTVAKFNKRAIHLYEKLGFVPVAEFTNHTTEFMTMIKDYKIGKKF
jgi:[ribosomal protein S18]-alanine N-acetyltransferase